MKKIDGVYVDPDNVLSWKEAQVNGGEGDCVVFTEGQLSAAACDESHNFMCA